MALSPIEMFRSNESSLAQILQGGSQTISGIMSQAIQIGRDMSNNQQAQESDLFAMRRNETALAQRRAENLQQNNEDAQRFARNAFENDRKFGVDLTQQTLQNNRQATNDLFTQGMQEKSYALNASNTAADNTRATTNDLFSQGMQEKNYRLNADNIAADNTRADITLTDQEAARKQEQQRLDNQSKNLERMFGNGAQDTKTTPSVTKESFIKSGGNPLLMGAVPDAEQIFPGSAQTSAKGVSSESQSAARAILSDPKASATDKRMASSVLGITGKTGAGGMTTYQQESFDLRKKADARAEDSSARTEEAAAQKQARENASSLVQDPVAFSPPSLYLGKKYGINDKGKVDTSKATPEEIADIEAHKNSPLDYELNAARNKTTAEAYVNLVPNATPEQKAKRRKLWEFANGTTSASVPAPAGARKFNPATGKIE